MGIKCCDIIDIYIITKLQTKTDESVLAWLTHHAVLHQRHLQLERAQRLRPVLQKISQPPSAYRYTKHRQARADVQALQPQKLNQAQVPYFTRGCLQLFHHHEKPNQRLYRRRVKGDHQQAQLSLPE